jgi:multiple sugar transport system permease protein
VVYSVVSGIGATVLAALAGYGFARFEFRGANLLFGLIIAGLLVPITLVAVPLYLVYAKVHLINSPLGMILPSMVYPVGVYLMRTYVSLSIPRDLTDAARVDGASELRIFFRVVLPLMVPGLMTVLLLSVAATWNNYILPLIIFSDNSLYPATVGMGLWSQHATTSGDTNLFPLLVLGGLVTIIPMIALFAVLQRYWRGGLLLGGVTG